MFFLKQKTAYEMRISDWSSDVCSSDLAVSARRPDRPSAAPRGSTRRRRPARAKSRPARPRARPAHIEAYRASRSFNRERVLSGGAVLRMRHPFAPLEHAVPVTPRQRIGFKHPAKLMRDRKSSMEGKSGSARVDI